MSAKAEYALRALIELALHSERAPLKIAAIAQRQQIPQKFLEVILAQLRGGGFVHSRRGAEGGYQLGQSAEAIRVDDIVRFVDGTGTEPPINTKGDDVTTEVLSEVMSHLQAQAQELLRQTTLADLADRVRDRRTSTIVHYDI